MSYHISIQVEDRFLLVSSIFKESDKIIFDSFYKIDKIPHAAASSSLDVLFKNNKWDKHSVAISIPSELCILRKFEVPFTNNSQIEQIIKYEAERYIAFGSIEEFVIDYLIISQNEKFTRLLVAAVPKSILTNLLSLFEDASIYPHTIELDVISLFHTSKYCHEIASSKSSLLVYVRDNGFSSIFLHNGSIKDFRSTRFGILSTFDNFSGNVNDTTEIPLNYGTLHVLSASYLEKLLPRFAKEFCRTLLNLENIDHIYLCGNSSLLFQLPDYLKSKHDINASLWDISSFIQTRNCSLPTEIVYSPITIGLALKEPEHGFNFCKDIFRYDKSFEIIKLPLSIFLTLLFFLLSFFLFLSHSNLNKQIYEYNSLVQIAESIYKSAGYNYENDISKLDKISYIRSSLEQEVFSNPAVPILDTFSVWANFSEHLAKAIKHHPFTIDSISIDQQFVMFSGKSHHDVTLDFIQRCLLDSLLNNDPNNFTVLSTQPNNNSTSSFSRQFKCQIKLKNNNN